MRAAVLHEVGGRFSLEEMPDPVPGPGEVVVDIRSSSVCNTDWHAWRGDMPLLLPQVMGHQVAGIVSAVGDGVPGSWEGRRVAVSFAFGCRHCWFCRRGATELCDNGRILGINHHGGMAERVAVPLDAVCDISAGLTFDEAALLACGFATPYRCFIAADIRPGDTVLILGGLLWGLASIQLVHAAGAVAIVADTDTRRLDQAKRFGADEIISDAADRPLDTVLTLTSGRGVDRVLEYSADADLMTLAVTALRKGGRMAMVGQATRLPTLPLLLDKLIFGECTLTGAFLTRPSDLTDCIRLAEAGRLDVESLISHRLPFTAVDEAMRLMNEEVPTAVTLHLGGSVSPNETRARA